VHQLTANLGGMLRTGLEDTFYLPNGERAPGNGALIEALATCARNAGRMVATPAQARAMLGLAAHTSA
jgi:3-keto-5-aminohexanoate cleavage enzyme